VSEGATTRVRSFVETNEINPTIQRTKERRNGDGVAGRNVEILYCIRDGEFSASGVHRSYLGVSEFRAGGSG